MRIMIERGAVFPHYTPRFDPIVFSAWHHHSLDLQLLDSLLKRGADLNALDVMDQPFLSRIVPKNSQEIPGIFDTTFPWDQNVLALLNRGAKIPDHLRSTLFECIHTLHPSAMIALSEAVAEHDRHHVLSEVETAPASSVRRRM